MLRSVLSPRGRLVLLSVVLAAGGVMALWASQHDPAEYMAAWPNSGPGTSIVMIVVFALASAAFVPRPLLVTGVGTLFNLPVALAVAVLGTVLGAGVAFGLGRVLGRDAVSSRLSRGTVGALEARFAEHGFLGTVLCRFVPVVPFAAVNYGAALTRVRASAFLAGTAVGTLPANVTYVAVGAAVLTGTASGLWPTLAIAALVITGTYLTWRRRTYARSGTVPASEHATR